VSRLHGWRRGGIDHVLVDMKRRPRQDERPVWRRERSGDHTGNQIGAVDTMAVKIAGAILWE
jgi:hypothetical protein